MRSFRSEVKFCKHFQGDLPFNRIRPDYTRKEQKALFSGCEKDFMEQGGDVEKNILT